MLFNTISVIGLGYIGLPTAAVIASCRKNVVGVDIDQDVVDTINKGKVHIVGPELDRVVHAAVAEGYLRATTAPESADAFLIATPTPFKGDHEPGMSYIESAAKLIAPVLKTGDLVILESTSPVGATEQMAAWLAEERHDLGFPQTHGEDSDIRIAYCPERVLPGHVVQELVENDRVIGGMTPKCSEAAASLYKIFVKGECVISGVRTAEMTHREFKSNRKAFGKGAFLIDAAGGIEKRANKAVDESTLQSEKDLELMEIDIHDRVTDAYYGKLGGNFMQETRVRIHWICAHVTGYNILDVGCSQGIVPILLAREGCIVTGIDICPRAIEEAGQYLAREPQEVQNKVDFINADFMEMDIQASEVDSVIMSELLEHLTRPYLFVEKAAGLLRKTSGTLVVTVPFGVNDYIDHKQTFYLKEPFELLGRFFEEVDYRVLENWIGFVAKRPRARGANGAEFLPGVVGELEKGFLCLDRLLHDKIDELAEGNQELSGKLTTTNRDIAILKRKQGEADRDAAILKRKLGEANRDVAILKRKLREANEDIVVLKPKLEKANRDVAILKRKLGEADRDIAILKRKLREANEDIVVLKPKLEKANRDVAILKRKKGETDRDVAILKRKLGEADRDVAILKRKRAENNRDIASLKSKLEEANRDVAILKQERAEDDKQLQLLKQKLTTANEKYHQATGVEIPALKDRLATQSNRTQELQEKLGVLTKDLHVANDKRLAAEKRVRDLRSDLTFKTGRLIHEQSRSMIGLLKIPVGLWRIYKQSRKRTQQRLARQVVATPRQAVAAPVDNPITPVEAPQIAFVPPQPLAQSEKIADLSVLLLPTQGSEQQKKVSCIMDDFTFNCYQPECQLQQLTPAGWKRELEFFQPELLFIESAWRGKDELWTRKVAHENEEVKAIVLWCDEHQVPTVFWSKEDPVHFETFLNTAKLFDFVFTTDIDCIHRYKSVLGHDRVYLLPFACQPALHNPIEVYQRKDAFSFAGSYYVRYPHRIKDLESFVENLSRFRPLEIYDRNYDKDHPDYQFPNNYQPYIVGTLPFNEIDKAYKGYRYAINLNSIKQSQTMFARRVFELLASNTLTISNFSRGIRLLFGDLVLAIDSGKEVVNRLHDLAVTPEDEDKLRLIALRKVMQEHTYRDRMNYLLSKVTGQPPVDDLPAFAVFTPVDSFEALAAVIEQVQHQNSVTIALYPIVSGALSAARAQRQLQEVDLTGQAMVARNLKGKKLADLVEADSWCCVFMPEDYYGPNYLLDIALASRYSQAQVVGKGTYYRYQGALKNCLRGNFSRREVKMRFPLRGIFQALACLKDGGASLLRTGTLIFQGAHQQGSIELLNSEQRYRPVTELPIRASAISPEAAKEIQARKWYKELRHGQYALQAQLAIDPFNYCHQGADEVRQATESVVKVKVNDLTINTGIETGCLLSIAENIQPAAEGAHEVKHFSPRYLSKLIGLSGSEKVTMSLSETGLLIRSKLPDGKHEYFFAKRIIARNELLQGLEDSNQFHLFFNREPGLNISLVILFLDADKQRISHRILRANANHTVALPLETVFVRLGLRIYAGGQAAIREVLFGYKDLFQPVHLIEQSDVLLLTNYYPSYEDLYRHGFVHSRVKSFQEQGVNVDIFCLQNKAVSWHEFQGVDITTGPEEALRKLLASGQYRRVLVHFLDKGMWQVLQEFIDRIKVTVWIHGSEIQPWWRRQFDYQDEEQLALTKQRSKNRLAFWYDLLDPIPDNLSLVFVSSYLAQVVMEDLQLTIPEQQYRIVHNPINTDLFRYQEKSAEQRKKILSIRPYASRIYANDLSVQAILQLAEEHWFDELEIRLIGDGPLFDDTLAPLKEFNNITTERRFLTQDEIAQYHKEYGIFLCPSRMDSQGVSRDEAMASGLVPVTNAVAAIPEFVDESCGILAAEEDAAGMAEGIKRLYEDPELYLRMSEKAAERVRKQTENKIIIKKELSIIGSDILQNYPHGGTSGG